MVKRLIYYWRLLWYGWWRPIEAGVFLIGLYDTFVGEFQPGWPRIGEYLPIEWSGWLIVLLIIILLAILEGSYRANQKSKIHTNFSINWENYEWQLRMEGWDSPQWENDKEGRSLLLKVFIGVNTIETARVESIELHFGQQTYPCIWESREFYFPEECLLECEIPLSAPRGTKTGYLKAIVDGEWYHTKSFVFDIPKAR